MNSKNGNSTTTTNSTHDQIKINPPNKVLRQNEPDHAIFESLYKPHLIEKFQVYRPLHNHPNHEILSVHIKLGTKLNGHPKIIHGGIIALLFDEAMGWARIVVIPGNDVYVTANLNIDYRSPLKQDSEVILRVYRGEEGGNDNGSKVRLRGVLDCDGKVVAEGTGLFVRVRSKL
jgi:acyl-coenzyme A thioesterase PaaI-like protein